MQERIQEIAACSLSILKLFSDSWIGYKTKTAANIETLQNILAVAFIEPFKLAVMVNSLAVCVEQWLIVGVNVRYRKSTTAGADFHVKFESSMALRQCLKALAITLQACLQDPEFVASSCEIALPDQHCMSLMDEIIVHFTIRHCRPITYGTRLKYIWIMLVSMDMLQINS